MTVVDLRPAYVGTRLGLWITLWIAVHIDAFCRRASRGRGWRLHRCILAYLTAELVYQFVHFAVVIQYDNNSTFCFAESNSYKVDIFFLWLTRSMFVCLILLVAVGYCILREEIGESLRKVIFIPIIYGVTSMVFDYVLLSTENEQVVTQQTDFDEGEDEGIDSNELKGLVLITCLLIKALVFVVAWVFVFEHLNGEIRLLKGEGDELPELDQENPTPVIANPVSPEQKTVADAVGDQAKLLLLTRFRTSLIIYIISIILANVLPVYIGNSSVEKIQSAITICSNMILLWFIAVLAWIFRPAADNPYLLLVDDFEGGEEGKEVVTELGVMTFEPATPQQSTTVLVERQQPDATERDTSAFALADDEDLEALVIQRQSPQLTTTPANTRDRVHNDQD